MINSEVNTIENINESILIDISLNSNSYNSISKTDLIIPQRKKKRCCSCCMIVTLSIVTSIITFTCIFLTDILKKT